ncbi:MAG: hypothetical protein P8Y81_13175, partial [Ignavibacteriaceae bacterium]
MLSIEKHKHIYLFLIFVILSSCGKKDEKPVDLNDPAAVQRIVGEILPKEARFSTSGNFTSDKILSIVAGTETDTKNIQGISFILIDKKDDEYKVDFRTHILDGSFEKCLVDKIKLSSLGGEMIYYNSKDYFIGTSGGDIYSYIIDFRNKEVYSAHLVSGKTK